MHIEEGQVAIGVPQRAKLAMGRPFSAGLEVAS